MKVENGEVVSEGQEEILDEMVSIAEDYFDENFTDHEYTTIRSLYLPISQKFEDFQEASGEILNNVQIDNASGQALDELCQLIGISRNLATRAVGEVTFYRDDPATSNINIPEGTYVRATGIDDEVTFETTEAVTLEEETTEVTAEIECTILGAEGNVAANTITSIVDSIGGLDGVYNENQTVDGSNVENDTSLRRRAKRATSKGSSSTRQAILTELHDINSVQSATIFKNDGTLGDMPGFEAVVYRGTAEEVGDRLVNNIAIGDILYNGNYGDPVETTVEFDNGQEEIAKFSRPNQVTIYIDASLEIKDEYEGDSEVKDSIVRYIGGILENGSVASGNISMGDDVIYSRIKYAIMDINGVFDITNLKIDTATPPESESNILIENFEIATTDATGNEIEITTTKL